LLEEFPKPAGIRWYRLGKEIGAPARRIGEIVKGDRAITADTDSRLCRFFDLCNGKELRAELEASGHRFRTKTDVEAILHLYEDNGIDCVKRLRCMFAFALWDSRHRSLMLARDRLGIKPLFYHLHRTGIAFGSEIKSILLSEAINPLIDPLALDDLMTLGLFPLCVCSIFSPRAGVQDLPTISFFDIMVYPTGQ